jgi:F-box and WD-40 domain protein CDC4
MTDKDSLRTRSTARDPLTKNENVLSLEGVRVNPQNPMDAVYPTTSSPPTPAPSPRPVMSEPGASSSGSSATVIPNRSAPTPHDLTAEAIAWSSLAPAHLRNLPSSALNSLLMSALPHLTPTQLTHFASVLPPRLKRDFLADLPPEIALHILGFVDDVKTLARASRVSRTWRVLVNDDAPWKTLCARRGFEVEQADEQMLAHANVPPHRRLSDTSGAMTSVRNIWASPPWEDTPPESRHHYGITCCAC